jgi:hypothetical protein
MTGDLITLGFIGYDILGYHSFLCMLDIKCDILVGFLDFLNIHSTLVHIWANNIGHISHSEGK